MTVNDVWATAKQLVAQHGVEARLFAESQALEELLCGDAEGSAAWEQVTQAVELLLDHDPRAFSPPATIH
jgi:hypothetical protein